MSLEFSKLSNDAFKQADKSSGAAASMDIDKAMSGGKTGEAPAVKGAEALQAGLADAGVDVGALSAKDKASVDKFGAAIDRLATGEPPSSVREVAQRAGDVANFSAVEGLKSDDGRPLNGFARMDGAILIDARLGGETLRGTAIEEVAEQAYHSVAGGSSMGDFGAGVAARVDGSYESLSAEDKAALGKEIDTMTVDGKSGEAASHPKYSGPDSSKKEKEAFAEAVLKEIKAANPNATLPTAQDVLDNADQAFRQFKAALDRADPGHPHHPLVQYLPEPDALFALLIGGFYVAPYVLRQIQRVPGLEQRLRNVANRLGVYIYPLALQSVQYFFANREKQGMAKDILDKILSKTNNPNQPHYLSPKELVDIVNKKGDGDIVRYLAQGASNSDPHNGIPFGLLAEEIGQGINLPTYQQGRNLAEFVFGLTHGRPFTGSSSLNGGVQGLIQFILGPANAGGARKGFNDYAQQNRSLVEHRFQDAPASQVLGKDNTSHHISPAFKEALKDGDVYKRAIALVEKKANQEHDRAAATFGAANNEF